MGKQLDELSKALASGVPRRRAFRQFAGGVLAVALGGLFPERDAHAAPDWATGPLGANQGSVLVNGNCITVNGRSVTVRPPVGSDFQLNGGTRCFFINGTLLP